MVRISSSTLARWELACMETVLENWCIRAPKLQHHDRSGVGWGMAIDRSKTSIHQVWWWYTLCMNLSSRAEHWNFSPAQKNWFSHIGYHPMMMTMVSSHGGLHPAGALCRFRCGVRCWGSCRNFGIALIDTSFGGLDGDGFLHTSVATHKQESAGKKDEQSSTEGDTDHSFPFLHPGWGVITRVACGGGSHLAQVRVTREIDSEAIWGGRDDPWEVVVCDVQGLQVDHGEETRGDGAGEIVVGDIESVERRESFKVGDGTGEEVSGEVELHELG